MAKKRTSLSQTLFRDINPYASQETETPAAAGLLQLPLTAVMPDPGQPRQLLPGPIAAQLEAGQIDTAVAMQQWLALPADDRLVALRQLADSIAQHGLINPITVRTPAADESAPAGTQYVIVTGERRYWAHVLLAQEGRQIRQGNTAVSPHTISALLTASGVSIRAHQLIENLLREDINAVEKAWGLWALRYELSGVNDSSPEAAEADLVPWTAVSDALGISARYRIFLTSVLNLSEEAQALVVSHNLAEMTIRPIVQKLKDRPDLQIEALRQLLHWQQEAASGDGDRAITRAVQELVDNLLQRQTRAMRAPAHVQLSPATRRFRRQVRSTLRFLDQLAPGDATLVARDLALDATYQETVGELQQLRQRIDTLLSEVAAYQAD
ncbi:MAG: ParB N-terminal domain-containing protein [Anaerolineales bacterium]|nr:ParB N-terminal domain-containing protein [Anaerolineales bacterium]